MGKTLSSIAFAPKGYIKLTPEQRKEYVNGCGAANAKFDFVPDNILGLDISEICNIHDYMYYYGETIQDKEEADRTFKII